MQHQIQPELLCSIHVKTPVTGMTTQANNIYHLNPLIQRKKIIKECCSHVQIAKIVALTETMMIQRPSFFYCFKTDVSLAETHIYNHYVAERLKYIKESIFVLSIVFTDNSY